MACENSNDNQKNKPLGCRLTKDIYDSTGTLLIKKGTVLQESMINMLEKRDISYEDFLEEPTADK